MEIRGKVKDILVKEGKAHDVRFALMLSDSDVVRLLLMRESRLRITIEAETEQLAFPDDAPQLTIRIDGQEYGAPGYLTGWQLKELAGLNPEETWLFGIGADAENGGERIVQIGDEDRIPLEPWLRFVSTPVGGVPIVIDDIDHPVAGDTITVAQLRKIAGVAPDAELFEVLDAERGDYSPIPLQDPEPITMIPGRRFVTRTPAAVEA